MATKVNKGSFSLTQPSGYNHEVVAQWKFSKIEKCDHFVVDWEYSIKDGKYVSGQTSSYTPEQSGITASNKTSRVTWTAPDNALKARARVKPVSITYGNKNDKTYFKGEFCGYKYVDFRNDPLPIPSLSVSFDANTSKATVTVTANDSDARKCRVLAKCNDKNVVDDKDKKLKNGSFTATYTLSAGQEWAFYAKTLSASKKESSWTSPTYAQAKPGVPSISGKKGASYGDDGVTFSWASSTGADTYTVEYVADNPAFFKSNRDAVRSVSGITGTTFVQTGLESGHTWYMRVQAVNEAGSSDFTDGSKISAKLALVPDAPTTYDTDPSYMSNDSARMRWTHNCEDNSEQTAAQVRMKLSTESDSQATTITVSPGTNMFLVRSLSSYEDGAIVQWSVHTKGNRSEWSPWSVWRQFSVYSTPTVTCTLSQGGDPVDDDEYALASLPMTVEMNASGGGSAVSGYHLTIVAEEAVEIPKPDGSVEYVGAGSVVYEKDYVTDEGEFEAEVGIEAHLPDVASLSATVEVVMASGLRAVSEKMAFATDFASDVPTPDCEVYFNAEDLTATIGCACYELDNDGMQTGTLADDIELSVYRICSDGSLELLASGLPNTGAAQVIDPHASFKKCEYRVVATDTTSGMTAYEDNEDASDHRTCVVQWAENWDVVTDAEDEDGDAIYEFTYNRISGLYNLNLDESGSMQSEDAEYIGRKHPVSYYGTQRGHVASYRVDFPKHDAETLAKCRRLMDYAGDSYVREPSGLGFWCRVSSPHVSRSYDSQAVSFTFEAIHVDHAETVV